MRKQEIIDLLIEKYAEFNSFINELNANEFAYSYQQKWAAGQHLAHLVLCIKPLAHVFTMEKLTIQQKFGLANAPGRSYEVLMQLYQEKLEKGGKAPDRFVPEMIMPEQRTVLSETLTALVHALCSKIDTFTEKELDTLSIPHPLLGKLSMREMLYNTIYHAEHHRQLASQSLNHMVKE
ncbi:MAG: DUF1569 domain-containing protein [Saonia sp.]